MSDPTTPTTAPSVVPPTPPVVPPAPKPPPDLPAPSSQTNSLTFTLPNVLQSVDSHSGRDVPTVINGGRQQVAVLSENWISDTIVPTPPLFVVQAQNQIQVGGQTINVINDPVAFNGKNLNATNPTATQYLAQVGKQVFLSFACAPLDPNSAVYRTYRDPTGRKAKWKNTPLYSVRQTSIILP